MHKINPRFECRYCLCTKKTREAFEAHVYLCKYIHTDEASREINNSTAPSPYILLNYIVDLTKKYEILQAKVEQLQSANHRQAKCRITEFLKTQTSTTPFRVWLEKCQTAMTMTHLEYLFERDALEAMQLFISQQMNSNADALPFRAFKQKANILYLYDRPTSDSQIFEWRIASNEDIRQMVNTFVNRLLRIYFEWHRDHGSEENSEERNANYMRKVNDASKGTEQKVNQIKKTMIEKIQTSL